MGVTVRPTAWLFVGLLLAVAALRIAELRISRRNQRALAARGAVRVPEKHFGWMVALHVTVLVAAATEVVVWQRPFIPWLALIAGAGFAAANATRWWVMRALGPHWNVAIMDSVRQDVVDAGPYRWVRHPNYAAVFLEMAALPLIHTAWVTAVVGALAHWPVLRARIAREDAVLLADTRYASVMGHKPRFLPRLTRHPPGQGARLT